MQSVPPCPAPAHWWQMQVSGLLLRWQMWLDAYSVGLFSFFSFCFFWLCYPLRFQNSPQTCLWEGFLVLGNFSSFPTASLGRVSLPNSFVSLFIFYLLSSLLSKTMGCLSGCLISSGSIQKLFCRICPAFKWSFDEFVWDKVASLSYSSAILGSPAKCDVCISL